MLLYSVNYEDLILRDSPLSYNFQHAIAREYCQWQNTRIYSVRIHYAASISIKSAALRISYAFAAKKQFKQHTKPFAIWPTGCPELGNRRVYCLTTKFTSLLIRNRIETQRQPALSLTPTCQIPNELGTSKTEHLTHRTAKSNGNSLHLTSFCSQTVFRSFSAQAVYDGS